MTRHDVIIIGGGPGGYIAAERLAHAGRSVLLADHKPLGGTCLNVGCIPTKSLLHSAKAYRHAREAEQFGVKASDVSYDWAQMQTWKSGVVATLVGGVTSMLRRLEVDIRTAPAALVAPGVVDIAGERHFADHVVIATGSQPVMPSIPGSNQNPRVVDSTGLLEIDHVPEHLLVIGGGVIGVEFASLFAALGARVSVVEMTDEICPFMDSDLAAELRRAIAGADFHLGCRVDEIDDRTVYFTDRHGQRQRLDADVILMAVGRRPVVEGWGAREAGIDHSPLGVVIDDAMRTNLPNVWAVGDVTGRSLLAHAAYRMGEIAAAHIVDDAAATRAGQVMRWQMVPWAVYSLPEAAGVGLTEAQARARYREVAVATVPLVRSGRFVAENGTKAPGLVKTVADATTGGVLGVHMVGPYAPEAIWGAVSVMENEFTVGDARQLVFPHPTVSEGIREALWAVRA